MKERHEKILISEQDISENDRKDFVKTFNISVDNDGYFELYAICYFDFSPASKGYRNDEGVPMEPDSNAQLDINAIEYNDKCIMHYLDDLSNIEYNLIDNGGYNDYL